MRVLIWLTQSGSGRIFLINIKTRVHNIQSKIIKVVYTLIEDLKDMRFCQLTTTTSQSSSHLSCSTRACASHMSIAIASTPFLGCFLNIVPLKPRSSVAMHHLSVVSIGILLFCLSLTFLSLQISHDRIPNMDKLRSMPLENFVQCQIVAVIDVKLSWFRGQLDLAPYCSQEFTQYPL